MRRILIYIVLLTAVLLMPSKGTDIGKLLPVEVVSIYKENGRVVLETDTQDRGVGNTVDEAVENLKATTAGILYLDTADYLLIDLSAAETVRDLAAHLKPSVQLCAAEPGIDLAEAAEFLAVHPPEQTLKTYGKAADLQQLSIEEERLILK